MALRSKTVGEFLDELASSSPAPGGGSVAAFSGALGTALVSMVCRLTIGKKKYAGVRQEMETTLKKSEELRASFSDLIEKDTEAFNGVMRAFALPKESEEAKRERDAAIEEATKKATLLPLAVMELCLAALPLTKIVAEKGNVNSVSDAGVAALMLRSACSGAALNVWINLAQLQDNSFIEETRGKSTKILREAEKLSDEVLALTKSRL
jgi:formiminotetrahydrofolate cyclodeaminase